MTHTNADGVSEKSSDHLAIFTDMNVDNFNHNNKTMPKQRVVYLNSTASNKNIGSNNKQKRSMTNSKSGVTLDPIRSNQAAHNKHMVNSASIESFQRRPVSGISKEGSQSRFR